MAKTWATLPRAITSALAAIAAMLFLAGCAGTQTAVGLTTNQDAYAEEKHIR